MEIYLAFASSSDFEATTGIMYPSAMIKIPHHAHFQTSLDISGELSRHQFSRRLATQ